MSRVILVRHGQTAWHAEGRYAGNTDVPLDEVGREQVRRVVARLEGLDIDYVFSSPLSRCLELAVAVASDHSLKAMVDERMREIDLGRGDGKTYKEIFEHDGELLGRWTRDPASFAVPGGESLQDVQKRALDWFFAASAMAPEGTVMVCSHGGPIRALIAWLVGMPLGNAFRLTVDLAAVSVVNYKGDFSNLELLNDRSHLDGLEKAIF